MAIKLQSNIIIECQWCHDSHHLSEWNDNTYSQCTSREMRRLYMQLTDPRAFHKNSGKFYKCPSCGRWLKGSQLVIKTADKSLQRLGGEQVIQLKSQGEE